MKSNSPFRAVRGPTSIQHASTDAGQVREARVMVVHRTVDDAAIVKAKMRGAVGIILALAIFIGAVGAVFGMGNGAAASVERRTAAPKPQHRASVAVEWDFDEKE